MAYIFAFEGMGGAGKTTVAKVLARFFRMKQYPFLWVNEKEYEPLRSWIINWHNRPKENKFFDISDIEQVAQARSVVHNNLLSQITSEYLLLLDRTVFTSMVYQQSIKNPAELIWEINKKNNIMIPERVFLFLGDPNVCYKRVNARAQHKSKYNLPATSESLDTIEEIGKRYLSIITFIQKLTVINAEGSVKTKLRQIMNIILEDNPEFQKNILNK